MASLQRAWSIDDLRAMAKRRLPKGVFEFFDGGAEDENTLRDNRAAWERQRLLPRVLNDVASVDCSSTLLGKPSALPLAIAPTGGVGFGYLQGDVAIARAAKEWGVPYTLSTSATASIERIAQEAPGRLWFQAYILKQRDFTMGLIQRAHNAGYEALMITVDLAVGGKRERDFRNDLALPFRYTPRNMLQFAARPRWSTRMLLSERPVIENLVGFKPEAPPTGGIVSTAGRNYDPSFNWDSLAQVRDAWPGKLIIKGIVRGDDALRAVRLGCDAIVVSNHGGRQLDSTAATFDALPAVVNAVQGRAEVWVDGGIRRGIDIVKALACGADGVLIGRATLYGALAAGEAGAKRAIEILHNEFTRGMQLCGARSIQELDASLLYGQASRFGNNG